MRCSWRCRAIVRQTTDQIRAPDSQAIISHTHPLPVVRAYVRRIAEQIVQTQHNSKEVPTK